MGVHTLHLETTPTCSKNEITHNFLHNLHLNEIFYLLKYVEINCLSFEIDTLECLQLATL